MSFGERLTAAAADWAPSLAKFMSALARVAAVTTLGIKGTLRDAARLGESILGSTRGSNTQDELKLSG